MTHHAELTRGTAAQAVAPNHLAQMGETGAVKPILAAAASGQSLPAPYEGIVIVAVPDGVSFRMRITTDPAEVASGNDSLYLGNQVWHFPIRFGERLAFFGETAGDITIAMAR